MSWDQLILNDQSRRALEANQRQPVQSLLLSGPVGVGLSTIARTLGCVLAGMSQTIVIAPVQHDKQKTFNINVDDIRSIVKISRNRRTQKLVVVIDEADQMTNSTTEVFLKTLEEPGQNLFFILTSHRPTALPMTIFSRVAHIEIMPAAIKFEDLTTNLRARMPAQFRQPTAQKLAQIKFLAANLPAEATRLLTDEVYFRDQSRAFTMAREFFAGGADTRLDVIGQLSERDQATNLLNNLAKILLMTATQRSQSVSHDAEMIATTLDHLAMNANLKAQLLALAVNFE
ncbi:MAG: AAA family ATPase [Candidatus Nanoperiomorbaceae bacterium]